MLSMLPITIGYIGGYETKSRLQAAAQSTWFSLGLATTLAGLGIVAALVGQVYGQVGIGLPIIVSIVAILMGLNLLEALPSSYHPLRVGVDFKDLPKGVRSSDWADVWRSCFSCSTPVLATLLVCHNPRLNFRWRFASVLHSYVAPLILAGTFTASIKNC